MIFKNIYRINKLQTFNYSGKVVQNNSKIYSSTVLLPKTNFSLRLENRKLVERDTEIAQVTEFEKLYSWQRQNLQEPEFVLHDGPPYANGKPHMGHAINKILKDTILRYHILKGTKVHYVPGWDCHGLPIELKALANSHDLGPLEVRSKARNFASQAIEQQMKQFKSWGVIGDWDNSYKTYDSAYVKNQLRIFLQLFDKQLIYRDFKPIYWSTSSRTALAEAELEYNDKHVSTSAFVRFKIKHFPQKHLFNNEVFALVWTTTPWTLPSNQCICYNPSISYCVVRDCRNDVLYIVATELITNLKETFKTDLEFVSEFESNQFAESSYVHPIYKNKILNFVAASHPSASKGTGLVHTAPAHGPEDFLVALSNKIVTVNLVDEFGHYTEEAGSDLHGKFVLSEGTKKILELLNQDLVHSEEFIHSYPYDWRTKQPVIIRASQQWFLDTDFIKNRALELLKTVEIFPKSNGELYKQNLLTQIKKRPYWCISRQRKWGVPIPVFYNKQTGNILLNGDLIEHYCKLIEKHGTDFWWKLSKRELISDVNSEEFEPSKDILDIWFDSGSSWSIALKNSKVANMYLEGVDQFTGWFQSSLLISVALRDLTPYQAIYVHGFAVDENGMKMSKSVGNVIDPEDIIKGNKKQKAYGVDVLRWWVACHANQDSIAYISNNVLKSSAEEIQIIRSVLRFALGALSDYNKDLLFSYDQIGLLDKYMLHLLSKFYERTCKDIENYKFNKVGKSVINLLTNSVSGLYYTGIKDRLYCEPTDSNNRRTAQFILLQLFDIVTSFIAPIVPHLVEEMYLHLVPKRGKTFFTSNHLKPDALWMNSEIEEIFELILAIKKDINKILGAATLNSIVILTISDNWIEKMEKLFIKEKFQLELEQILQVSKVLIENHVNCTNYTIKLEKSNCFSCPRCRRFQSEVENQLCKRCEEVVRSPKLNIVLN